MEAELAERLGEELVQKSAANEGEVFAHHLHRTDDSNNSLAFLSSIGTSTLTLTAGVAKPPIFVLSSTPSAQTTSTVSTVLVTSHDANLVKAAGDLLKANLGVKGGGKGTKWSGKYVGVWKESQGRIIEEILEDIRKVN